MGGRRHRRRQLAEPFQVVAAQRPDPPGVVLGAAQPRQQQPACDELEAEQRGGAPERGGGGGVGDDARPGQDRQGVPYGKPQCRNRTRKQIVPEYGQLRQRVRSAGRGAPVRVPERDTAGTGRVPGDEDRGAAGQFGDLGRGCHRVSVHGDVEFLKFD